MKYFKIKTSRSVKNRLKIHQPNYFFKRKTDKKKKMPDNGENMKLHQINIIYLFVTGETKGMDSLTINLYLLHTPLRLNKGALHLQNPIEFMLPSTRDT